MTRRMHVYRIELRYKREGNELPHGIFDDRLQLFAADPQGAVRKAFSMSKPYQTKLWKLIRIDITQLQ